MNAKEYLKERTRMCGMSENCDFCYLIKKRGKTCWALELEDIDESIKVVEQWSEEHPIKTRQTEFLKMFPNARVNVHGGVLDIMACAADRDVIVCDKDGDCKRYIKDGDCGNCCKEYWNGEVK